ncbi:Fve family of fungal immunomodulatory protein [Trametes polyzona]|nr:Fve family of fungal immunomodulatory protein [Trametes polyzona]
MSSTSSLLLHFASMLRKIHIDYTPQWTRGDPDTVIVAVTFPRVLADKRYSYRVLCGDVDLGIRGEQAIQSDGSQTVNFLEYNHGVGVSQKDHIRVYIVDPDNGNQYLVAQRN